MVEERSSSEIWTGNLQVTRHFGPTAHQPDTFRGHLVRKGPHRSKNRPLGLFWDGPPIGERELLDSKSRLGRRFPLCTGTLLNSIKETRFYKLASRPERDLESSFSEILI